MAVRVFLSVLKAAAPTAALYSKSIRDPAGATPGRRGVVFLERE
jgi:hypothetical protein